ncbi:MAG: PDZ domain-containing protein [Flavobacteriales bacterium]|nr:PDZ domain-containing protein [Flavobacteriales bacterium]
MCDPATLPLIGAYPNCDHAMRWSLSTDPGYAAERYFSTSPEGLLELAEHGPLIDYVFDAPELSLAAPLAYGDTVDDAWCYTSAGLGVNYHFCGLTRHTLDATGTLVMPYGTIPDVLRTRTRTYHVSDDTPADTSYNITHAWWVPGLRWPLLEHNRFIDSNGNELISVTVLGASQALAVPDRSVVDALLYPVPFRDELTLRFWGRSATEDKCRSMHWTVGRSLKRCCHRALVSTRSNSAHCPQAPCWSRSTRRKVDPHTLSFINPEHRIRCRTFPHAAPTLRPHRSPRSQLLHPPGAGDLAAPCLPWHPHGERHGRYAAIMGIGDAHGVLLSEVLQNGSGEAAGWKRGDLLTELDGKLVGTTEEVFTELAKHSTGSTVGYRLLRDKKPVSGKLKLLGWPGESYPTCTWSTRHTGPRTASNAPFSRARRPSERTRRRSWSSSVASVATRWTRRWTRRGARSNC